MEKKSAIKKNIIEVSFVNENLRKKKKIIKNKLYIIFCHQFQIKRNTTNPFEKYYVL